MIFTTHYYISGLKWSGPRINAISWGDAEYQASIQGVKVDGILVTEMDYDGSNRIDYDVINEN